MTSAILDTNLATMLLLFYTVIKDQEEHFGSIPDLCQTRIAIVDPRPKVPVSYLGCDTNN